MKIEVAYAVHDPTGSYCCHVGTSIASLLACTKEQVHIHVLHNETLTEANRQKLVLLVQQYGQALSFHQVEVAEELRQMPGLAQFTEGTLFRLHLPSLLPDCRKLIYLDGDTIVNLDIKELWEETVEEVALAAVLDAVVTGNKLQSLQLNSQEKLNLQGYFNAGVLLLNLGYIRGKCQLYEAGLAFFRRNPRVINTDQTLLNCLFQEHCLYLDGHYNYYPGAPGSVDQEKHCIYHFTGVLKPWMVRRFQCDWLYWRAREQTPWRLEKDLPPHLLALPDVLDDALLHSPIEHRRVFLRNVWCRLWRELRCKLGLKGKWLGAGWFK